MPFLLGFLLAAAMGSTPPQVTKVLPPEGSASARIEAIGAELDLTKGAGGDPGTLTLLVDGEDVTARARITMTRDWPPSFVSITVTPAGLTSGSHRAAVRFRTSDGKTISYGWSFVAK
jgi:hypothetical protein